MVLLAAATAGLFSRTADFAFLSYDDIIYITDTPAINGGLTAEGLQWAITQPHGGNWHPLTGVSHMIDCELFGHEDATGHHLVNAALHVINTLLMYWALFVMTRRAWCSAFVAAVFALHPLHVESVAWISERKDVLSAMFGLLTLIAYAWYARRGGVGRYALVFIALALGLLAKPMLVTWPLLLLLLDYWPLRRMRELQPNADAQHATECAPRSFRFLIVEKLPLLALSLISSVMTIWMQRQAQAMFYEQALSAPARAFNAVMSYTRYLGRTFWPDDLAAIYPHPYLTGGTPWSGALIIVAVAMLAVITIVCVIRMRRRPYLAVGWLWYLGTLIPVIGLVQVGRQAMADRFTYLPMTGVLIMVTWAVADALAARPSSRALRSVVCAIAVIILVACSALTWRQLGYWRDSETLFTHSVVAAPGSSIAHNLLGDALFDRAQSLKSAGRFDKADEAHDRAIEQFERAITIAPHTVLYYVNLGSAYFERGRFDDTIRVTLDGLDRLRANDFATDQQHRPHLHLNLAKAYYARGKINRAINHAEQALADLPNHRPARRNLALMLARVGRVNDAIIQYEWLLADDPSDRAAERQIEALRRFQGR